MSNNTSNAMSNATSDQVSLPTSHHGAWHGANRLWIMDPAKPFRSDGSLEVAGRTLRYTWSHEGAVQTGMLELRGQPAALKASWHDTFHATDPFTLHGFLEGGELRLFTTYDAGDACWGWRVELDFRDPEACTMRMFNVMPGLGAVPAVVLHGTRG